MKKTVYVMYGACYVFNVGVKHGYIFSVSVAYKLVFVKSEYAMLCSFHRNMKAPKDKTPD